MSLTPQQHNDHYPDLWGLTANDVAKRKSTATLSLQEYHLDQDQGAQSEVRSLESVAFYPLHLLLNNLTPFNYSVTNDKQLPKAFLSVFQNSIKLYQLYVFYVYAISELGSLHAEKILALQSNHLDTCLSIEPDDALTARFDDISHTAKQHAQRYASKYEYVALDIPIENSIAKSFLLSNRESPLYVGSNKRSQQNEINFRGMDLALTEHMGRAKDIALQVYARYFNIVIVKV